jgi:hypothetical protein
MCKILKISLTGVIFLSLLQYLLHADVTAVGQNIVIFKTSVADITTNQRELNESLGLIEKKALQVFQSLSRFTVGTVNHTVSTQDILPLLEKIKTYKNAKNGVTEEVRIGKTVFSAEDFNNILHSYLIVVPVMTGFTIETLTPAGGPTKYNTNIAVTYTIIKVENATVLSNIELEATGYDKDQASAVNDAIEDLPIQLTYEVRSLDVFSLQDRIVEVLGPDAAIRLGREQGVSVGDEYAIITPGETGPLESGLIIIHDIEDKVSLGKIIYAAGSVTAGMPVREVPRVGLEMVPYVHVEMNFENSTYYGSAGLKLVLTKGFFVIRPVVCFEVGLYPFEQLETDLPVRVFGGLDFNIYLGRFQLGGMAAVGTQIMTALSPASTVDGFEFSYIGLAGIANISYLVTRDVKLILDLGYQAWFTVNDNYQSYEGWLVGAGIGIKF